MLANFMDVSLSNWPVRPSAAWSWPRAVAALSVDGYTLTLVQGAQQAYFAQPHETVYGAPEEKQPTTKFRLQDNADKFRRNKKLADRGGCGHLLSPSGLEAIAVSWSAAKQCTSAEAVRDGACPGRSPFASRPAARVVAQQRVHLRPRPAPSPCGRRPTALLAARPLAPRCSRPAAQPRGPRPPLRWSSSRPRWPAQPREEPPDAGCERRCFRANELPGREARPGRRVNNSAAGKLQGGKLREDCVEGRGVRGVRSLEASAAADTTPRRVGHLGVDLQRRDPWPRQQPWPPKTDRWLRTEAASPRCRAR